MSQLALDPRAGLDTARFPSDARLALRLLERMRHGRLDVTFPDGQHAYFGDLRSGERADLQLANWKLIRAALKSGDIGFAESYLAGDWSTHDLVRLMEFFVANRAAAEDVIYGSFIGRLAYRLRHLLNRNTRTQARRNVHAHYDLGNAFYALWLDRTMSYSSALFERPAGPHEVADTDELERGQQAKYERVLAELDLPAGARLLEIGCGWGGLAEVAARAGHTVTGLTLSTEQLDYARDRLVTRRAAGGPAAARLPRGGRPLRRHRFDRDVRGGRRSLLAVVLRHAAALPEAGRARLPAIDRDRRRRCTRATASAPTSSSSTSFPAACCRRHRSSARRPRRPGSP